MENNLPGNVARPLVSVIIPIYNGERYLAQAIESVLCQTYAPVEIIVIDDGSTDSSAQVAQLYIPPIHYVARANSSTGNARNAGVELASGDYLAFLDQDDVWLCDKLALQMAAFEAQPQLEAVFGEVEQFYESPNSALIKPGAPSVQGFSPSVMLVKKQAFRRIGPFEANLQIGEWVDWFARASDLKLNMMRLPRLVARRRIHAQNKGVRYRAARVEYALVLKASLDRRRAKGELS